jgi:uncharacterized membrane protein
MQNYFSKTRVEAFSDGIFAIIITLLVLEIKVPAIENHNSSIELFNALAQLLSKILSWLVSFIIVCVIWVNHHLIFQQIKTVSHTLFWLNANLLLWCAFIPFPSALLGDYVTNSAAQMVFGIVLSIMAFSFVLIRLYLIRNPILLNDNVNMDHYKTAMKQSVIFGPVLYLAGAFSSLIHPYLAFGIFFFIPLYFIFFYNSNIKKQQFTN